MRHFRVLMPAVALVLAAAPAQARVSTPDSARVATNASARVDAPIPEATRARIEGHRERARALFELGRNADARRELMTAASLMRESGVLPSVELITVATIALVEERPLVAAAAMDDLAANAEAFDKPDVEAQALLEAATQYAAAGEFAVARERHELLRTLLASTKVANGVRAEVEARVVAQR